MEFKTNELNQLDIQSTGEVSNMKLDDDSQAMIFQMFTGGLYSDPIGTVIREITSNCFDSHVEANVDSTKNPVLVELGNEGITDSYFIAFTDKGVGMSPDRIRKIYGTYFKSTKRKTNNQIGGFGLGGKTPLAYTESFYIITRYDGIEYIYNIFEGNQVPAIELMSQTSTDKPNGTTVKVPIKKLDIKEFEKKTFRQLYYFENIYFKGFSDNYVTNDYQIVKGKNFLYRGNSYSDKIHVCYGKVAYPLDYEAMGLDSSDYRIPIAIRLEIGELEGTGVTPSREALKYSKENVRIIKNRIDDAIKELTGMLSTQYQNVETLVDYYNATTKFGVLNLPNGIIYLSGLINRKDVTFPKFRYNILTIPAYDKIIKDFFDVKLYGKKYPSSWRKRDSISSSEWDLSLGNIKHQPNIFFVSGEFNRVLLKQSYLKTLNDSENFYLVSPKKLDKKTEIALLRKYGVLQEKLTSVVNPLNNDIEYKVLIPRKKGLRLLTKMRTEILELFAEHCENYDEIEVPESFIESRKKQKLSKEVLMTTIPVKDFGNHGDNQRITMNQLHAMKGTIYYGFQDDVYLLRNAVHTHNNLSKENAVKVYSLNHKYGETIKNGTMFIRISKGNEKLIRLMGKKAIHVKYFYKNFVSRKLNKISASVIGSKLKNEFEMVSGFIKSEAMKHVCEETYNEVKSIKRYLATINTDYVYNISLDKLRNELSFDVDAISSKNQHSPTIKKLVELSRKNNDRMKWFNLPWGGIDPTQAHHQELIAMLQLVFEK